MADFEIERRLKSSGFDTIIGVDEAGRGPLAGPLVAAAICLNSNRFRNRIDDSKKISARNRLQAFSEIIQKSIFCVSIVDKDTIDDVNILVATRVCMQAAIKDLLRKIGNKKVCILVDGNIKLDMSDAPVFNIIRGDARSKTIAAASIVAKVVRDRIMLLYDRLWPEYGFLRHKGYPTSYHRKALRQFGPCPIHRLTFSYA